MADFTKFTKTGFSFKFKGDELDKEPVSKYRLIPEGEHDFTVKDYKFGTTQKGDDKVSLTLLVDDVPDENGNDQEIYVGDDLTIREDLLPMSAAFFSAIGMWEEVKRDGVTESTWDKTIGKTGSFVTKHDTFNGKTKNKVRYYIKKLKPAVQ